VRRRSVRLALVVSVVGMILLLAPTAASAHPLGNFTVNLYSGLVVVPGELRVQYVMDMAEIPTFQEMSTIDADGTGQVSPAEFAAYAKSESAELLRGLSATAGGAPISFDVRRSAARFRPGQGGLHVLRLEAVFVGRIPDTGAIKYRDRNDPDRIGWREITAVGARGEVVLGSSVPSRSVSEALLRYPTSLLKDPLRVTQASFRVAPGASGAVPGLPSEGQPGARPGLTGSAFARLATWSGLSVPVLLLALLLAMGFGAAHALLPGHGKTIMAGYLVGAGGRLKQAVQVGVAVAFMHTFSVLAIGVGVLILARFAPEQVYPWLTLATGVLVAGMGVSLVVSRARAGRAGRDHPHPHTHDHPHDHDHPHGDLQTDARPEQPLSRRSLAGLAVAGGILPSPTALVVLLSTAATHRVVFGLALILAFSVGLAGALVMVGLLALRARGAVYRRLNGRAGRLVPIVSGTGVVGVGVFLALRGVLQVA
jgi:nickel/cobalt transporter (NicO) family protein